MTVSYEIDRAAHQQKLRAELELLNQRGPQLPGIVRTIERGVIVTRKRTVCGRLVGID